MISLVVTVHAARRMKERGVDKARAELAVNNPDITIPGNDPAARVFIDKEPPPPVKAVTSWPPDADGRLRLITCINLDKD